jgi:hypothetical protein
MPQNRHLRTLELCRCKVGDEGALAILDALEKNSSLTKCAVAPMLHSCCLSAPLVAPHPCCCTAKAASRSASTRLGPRLAPPSPPRHAQRGGACSAPRAAGPNHVGCLRCAAWVGIASVCGMSAELPLLLLVFEAASRPDALLHCQRSSECSSVPVLSSTVRCPVRLRQQVSGDGPVLSALISHSRGAWCVGLTSHSRVLVCAEVHVLVRRTHVACWRLSGHGSAGAAASPVTATGLVVALECAVAISQQRRVYKIAHSKTRCRAVPLCRVAMVVASACC